MAYQLGSTTRLRHINYSENQPRVPPQWDKTADQNMISPLHKNTPFSLEGSDSGPLRNQSEKADKANIILGNHRKEGLTLNLPNYRVENTQGKITNKGITYSSHFISTRGTSSSSPNIEIDVLESFSEFAAFLELQNPICPAEHLDTPEKLMNVLSWDVWVQ